MLKKLFKTKYVPYDAKYIQLSAEDERNIRTITDDIKNYIARSDKASNINYHTRKVFMPNQAFMMPLSVFLMVPHVYRLIVSLA